MKKIPVKSYLYLNIANRNDAISYVLSVHYRCKCDSSVNMFLRSCKANPTKNSGVYSCAKMDTQFLFY